MNRTEVINRMLFDGQRLSVDDHVFKGKGPVLFLSRSEMHPVVYVITHTGVGWSGHKEFTNMSTPTDQRVAIRKNRTVNLPRAFCEICAALYALTPAGSIDP